MLHLENNCAELFQTNFGSDVQGCLQRNTLCMAMLPVLSPRPYAILCIEQVSTIVMV